MKYLSLCAGIEAASVAWHHMGWEPVAFSEIESFPSAVLANHYPNTPNWGDMTKYQEWPDANVNVLVGGTPCQSFSVAGLRKGLEDPRGNLMLTYLAIADRYRPKWLVWENVPGVLSSNSGRDFGAFLGGLGQLGYGFAYRVLDAQYFGVAQRRRRVFVVGCLGGWQRAAAVLFERHSLSGHPAPSRETGKAAPTILSRSTAGGGLGTDFDCDGGVIFQRLWRGSDQSNAETLENMAGTLNCNKGQQGGILFDLAQITSAANRTRVDPALPASTLSKGSDMHVATAMQVRRLTPVECERLQGFPDGYTAISWRGKSADQCPDGPRYKALGNSMAVPVMRWIGERIQAVENIP